ncbi:MAG TPA: ATP-binding cassette domain-containing protein, partial [Thermoanaerobaculia bacterium]
SEGCVSEFSGRGPSGTVAPTPYYPSKKPPYSSSSPALELRRISKRFGATQALSEANLVILPGEIHALLGENGAGKSTLVAIAAGRLPADSGEILRHGLPVAFRRARDARDAGLALVPQHDLLIGAASVGDNLAFLEPAAPFFESAAARRGRVARIAKAFAFELGDADARVDTLPVGIRQRIEIAGALASDPDILILDEPTAVLSPDETAALFASLRARADAGGAVVLITHRLAEVFAGADRLTLLARGKSVKTCRVSDTTPEEIGGLLIASAEGDIHPSKHAARSAANSVTSSLTLTDFAPRGTQGKQISLSLSPGELLVLLAIDGNGANTIARAIAGLEPFEGDVALGGIRLPGRGDPLAFRAAGGAFVPADRREEGLVAALSLSENLALPDPPGRLFLDRRAMRSHAELRLAALGVRMSSADAPAGSLSGGNQQKLVLARELARPPRLLVAVHPTRGLDLASAAAVRRRILEACRADAAALVVTADPDEAQLFGAPIRVVYRGQLSAPYAPATPAATLGRLMAGVAA